MVKWKDGVVNRRRLW